MNIVTEFYEAMNIVFENGLLKVANIITDKIKTKEVEAEKLCIGQTCVTEQELKALLEGNGIQASQTNPSAGSGPTASPSATSTPEITPEPTPTTPTSLPSPDSSAQGSGSLTEATATEAETATETELISE